MFILFFEFIFIFCVFVMYVQYFKATNDLTNRTTFVHFLGGGFITGSPVTSPDDDTSPGRRNFIMVLNLFARNAACTFSGFVDRKSKRKTVSISHFGHCVNNAYLGLPYKINNTVVTF